ncbi:MAG TPA: hypothetical protein VL551_34090 [Actinospica sp.]|jgi:hypothetical protein|nr:hypothetical protein [Actinospica sp.]
MDELRNGAPGRYPARCFQIDTVHTAADTAPWFTGHWMSPDRPAPERVALRLWLTPEPNGQISVLLTADDEHVYGQRHRLAAWSSLPARTWTAAVAPTIAAHQWAAHTHHGWTKRDGGNKVLRAALACILTR